MVVVDTGGGVACNAHVPGVSVEGTIGGNGTALLWPVQWVAVEQKADQRVPSPRKRDVQRLHVIVVGAGLLGMPVVLIERVDLERERTIGSCILVEDRDAVDRDADRSQRRGLRIGAWRWLRRNAKRVLLLRAAIGIELEVRVAAAIGFVARVAGVEIRTVVVGNAVTANDDGLRFGGNLHVAGKLLEDGRYVVRDADRVTFGRSACHHKGHSHKDQRQPSKRLHDSPHITTRTYARIVEGWVESIGLDPSDYGTHSLRRTKASLLYKMRHNLREIQILLGHKKIESTVHYLGITVEDALESSEHLDL